MGKLPDWYVIMSAARYLNVPPWDLLDQPISWITWAHQAQKAENEAEKQKQESMARRNRG